MAVTGAKTGYVSLVISGGTGNRTQGTGVSQYLLGSVWSVTVYGHLKISQYSIGIMSAGGVQATQV